MIGISLGIVLILVSVIVSIIGMLRKSDAIYTKGLWILFLSTIVFIISIIYLNLLRTP